MTSTAGTSGYARYADQVKSLAARDNELATERADLKAASADSVNQALIHQRSTRERLAAADQRLGRLERDIAMLAARAGVSEPVQAQPVQLSDLAGVDTFLRALTSDTESARAAWDWVERARAQQPPATPAQTYVPPMTQGGDAQRADSDAPAAPQPAGRSRMFVLVGAASFLVAVVLLIVKAL